ATLYEFWCFIQLASVVRQLCGATKTSLVATDASGMRFDLRRGHQTVVSGSLTRLGRRIDLSLYFNREFPPGAYGDRSWTRSMRPDSSLRLSSADDREAESIWVHFDAKYRIDSWNEIFVDAASEDDGMDTLARP